MLTIELVAWAALAGEAIKSQISVAWIREQRKP